MKHGILRMIKEQKSNAIEILTGLLVLLAAISFFLFSIFKAELNPKLSEKNFVLKANFESAEGLRVGSEVFLAGVKVGSVQSIQLDRTLFSAVVTLSLFDDYKLPDDSEAAIISDGFFGDKQVKLTAGGSLDTLGTGDEILFTQSSLNIINLLNKFSSK